MAVGYLKDNSRQTFLAHCGYIVNCFLVIFSRKRLVGFMNTVGQQVFRRFSDIADLLATLMLANKFMGAVLHFKPTYFETIFLT